MKPTPQNNFYLYANQDWLDNTELPADKSYYSTFNELEEKVNNQLRNIIDKICLEVEEHHLDISDDDQKIYNLYKSYMDVIQIQKLNTQPLEEYFTLIKGIQDRSDLMKVMISLHQIAVTVPFLIKITPDLKNTDKMSLNISQAGLSLPDNKYYSDRQSQYLEALKQYYKDLFKLAKVDNSDEYSNTMCRIESLMAKAHWDLVECRDFDKTYNPFKLEKLNNTFANIPWALLFEVLGLDNKQVVYINQLSYFDTLNKLFEEISIEQWKIYGYGQLLNRFAPYLNYQFENAYFNLYEHTIKGVKAKPTRDTSALKLVNYYLQDLMGERYVTRYYQKENNERIDEIINDLIEEFRKRCDKLAWLDSKMRKELVTKLYNIKVKSGNPKKWKNYNGIKLSSKTLINNIAQICQLQFSQEIEKLNNTTDHDAWRMPVQSINACYDPHQNAIIIPAAMIQPPFFSHAESLGLSYGAIGAIIAHEISHAFDDQGAKFDAKGNLSDWWSPRDLDAFCKKAHGLVEQYNHYSPISGHYVNGNLTLGENIADLTGVTIALGALKSKCAPNGEQYSKKQIDLFFKSWATIWRCKATDEEKKRRISIDHHAPNEFRVNGVLSNIPEFYSLYNVKASDSMYIPENKQVKIW